MPAMHLHADEHLTLTKAKQETMEHNETVDTWTTSLTESGRALEKQNLYWF